jgi:hypothetical protein
MNSDEISSFTRIVYKSQKSKDIWNDRIPRISKCYNEAEYEMVKRKYRKACTIHIDMHNMQSMMNKINNDGLIFTPIAESAYRQGFQHRHIEPTIGEPSYWYGSLTHTVSDGKNFNNASKSGGGESVHIPIGQMLGYPTCCSKKFIKIWNTGNFDGMFEIAKDTPGVTEEINDNQIIYTIEDIGDYSIISPLLRYHGMRIVSHFPCSLKCNKSLLVAQRWKKVMCDIDKEALQWCEELLASIDQWSALNGVVEVDTPYFRGSTHTYPYEFDGVERVIKIDK